MGMLPALHDFSTVRRRLLLIMKVRDGFTMAILLLGQFNASGKFGKGHQVKQDSKVGPDGSRKVLVFGLASWYRRKFEASERYRLCLCEDLLQLYEDRGKAELTKDAVGGSTFVYLKSEAHVQSSKGSKHGKGFTKDAKGGKWTLKGGVASPKGSTGSTKVSVALQNFDQRGADLFGGRVTKVECVAWELYTEPTEQQGRAEKPGKLLHELYLGSPLHVDLGSLEKYHDKYS